MVTPGEETGEAWGALGEGGALRESLGLLLL